MHNTGNPLPSKDILDLYDNSEAIDQYVNSQEETFPDRFGTKRLTLAGLIKRSMTLRNEINNFSGALTFRPEWTDVPMNVSEGVGSEGGALNLQAEALGNRSEINKIISKEALRRSCAEAGYTLVAGSFEAGGTLVNANDVLLQERTGKVFSGPVGIVAAGTNPTPLGSGGWIDRSDVALRGELISGGMSVDDISKINTIVEDCTLNVPADYPDVNTAFNYLRTKNISPFATVVIKIEDGNYVWNTNQNCNHHNGDRVNVIGNQTTPTNVTISTTSAPTFDMFSCTDGNHLGLLDGVYITAPTKALLSNNFTAVLADNSSSIKCGPKVKVNNWYYGIAARNGSFIYCRYTNVSNAGDVGIWSFNGSTVDAQYATVINAVDSSNNWGWGFEAEYGSFLDCSYGSGSGCQRGGAGALSNSTVRALYFNGSSNIGSGLYVLSGGTIEAHNATLNNNTKYGYEQEQNGQIYGANITTTGNTIAPYSNYAYFDNSMVNGARIAANGSLRIDTNGANPVYFNTSGGCQFEVAHASSAVNHPYATGSSSGSAVVIGATGTDAVIDLAILPKGAGSYVKLGSGFVASSDAPVVGYVYIKDDTGTVRKLAVVA